MISEEVTSHSLSETLLGMLRLLGIQDSADDGKGYCSSSESLSPRCILGSGPRETALGSFLIN